MEKISKIFSKKKKFKGEGHRLGSSEKKEDRRNEKPSTSARDTSQAQVRPFQGRHYTATAPLRSQEASSRSEEAVQRASISRPDQVQHPAARTGLADAGNSATQSQDVSAVALRASASVEVRAAVDQLLAGIPGCSKTLQTILLNIVRNPAEAKYRKIRLGNPKIQAAVVEVDGGLELLQACGFLVDNLDSETDVFAYLPEDENLEPLLSALALLGHSIEELTPGGSSVAKHQPYQELGLPATTVSVPEAIKSSSEASKPCNRETVVIVPQSSSSAGADVADWVYERGPAELKAAIKSAQKKREQSEMLLTRATREKLQMGNKPNYVKATVRVRLPEGLLVQGIFNAQEQVAEIFNWLTDCLADPGQTFDLILPNRKVLVVSLGTLKQADLLPSVILHFQAHQQMWKQLSLKPSIMENTVSS